MADATAPEEKKLNPYERLKQEKEAEIAALKAQLAAVQQAPTTAAAAPVAAVTPELNEHDWNQPVTVYYDAWVGRRKEVRSEVLPKKQALDRLVQAYINRPMVDKNVLRFDEVGRRINDAPCYVRISKRNRQTGEEITVVKDLALWAVADEILNRPERKVDLVTPAEYEAFYRNRAENEKQWQVPIQRAKVAKAIEALAQD